MKTSGGITLDDFKIKRIEVPDPEYESEIPKHWKLNLFPGFPSTILVCGPPGQGKTNLLMNLLLNKYMWNGFFDEIYGYGPTVKSDKLYKRIQLKPHNVIDEVEDIIPDLEEKLANQTSLVAHDPKQAPKCLFIFEDMTSFFNKIQSKPVFHRCYTQIRHAKGTSICCVHKYHAFNRTPRTSSQHVIMFDCNMKDIKHCYEEFGGRLVNVNEFHQMVEYALTPTDDNPKPFFYINTLAPKHLRFRKSFTEILELEPTRMTKPLRDHSTRARSRSPNGTTKGRRSRSRDKEILKSSHYFKSNGLFRR